MRWKKASGGASSCRAGAGRGVRRLTASKGPGGPEPAAEPKDTSAVGNTTDPTAKAPAAEVPGAQKGGEVTVYADVAPHTFDPTRAYFIDANAILRLVDAGTDAVAVPRRQDGPGSRHGDRPRHAQRGLHRVEVHAAGRPQVRGRHAGQVAGRRLRDQAVSWRSRSCRTDRSTGSTTTWTATSTRARSSLRPRAAATTSGRRDAGRQDASSSRCASRSPTCRSTRRSRTSAAIPRGEGHPGGLRPQAAGDRPVQVREVHAGEGAHARQERAVGPGDRHQRGTSTSTSTTSSSRRTRCKF